jgi:hypothetical protein
MARQKKYGKTENIQHKPKQMPINTLVSLYLPPDTTEQQALQRRYEKICKKVVGELREKFCTPHKTVL